MPTVAATVVVPAASGINEERRPVFRCTVPPALNADTIQITLPARWRGKGLAIINVSAQKFGAGLPGARTRTHVTISSQTYVESSGLLAFVIGAAFDGAGGNEVWVQTAEALT